MSLQTSRIQLLLIYAAVALPWVVYGAAQATRTNANSPLDWVPATFAPRRDYDDFCRVFGPGDVVVASWPGCTIDQPRLDELANLLRKSPSFADGQGQPYFQRVVTGREMLASLGSLPREEAVARLKGTLIGPDGRTTCLVVTFNAAGLARRGELVPKIQSAISTICEVRRGDQHLAGPVIDGLSVDEASKRALDRLALPSSIITLVVCWWCLKNLRAALLVFGIALYCQAMTLALVHYCGESMSALLIVLPPLIQVLAVAGGLHLVNYYYDAAAQDGTAAAPRRAFQLGWLPCVLSSGTTAVGMGSLMVSQLSPIRSFGAYSAAGVLATTGLLLILIPAVLTFWPLRPRARESSDIRSAKALGVWPGGWSVLTRFLSRYHFAVASAGLLAMVAAGGGLHWLQPSVRIETLFADQSRMLQDYRWLEKHVAPLVPIEIVVACDGDCRLTLYERMYLLSRLQRELAGIHGVGGTLSAVNCLPSIPPAGNVPVEIYRQRIEQMLDAGRSTWHHLALLDEHADRQQWRLTGYVSALGDADYGRVLETVKRRLDPLFKEAGGVPIAGVTARYTGIMPLVHEIQHQLLVDLFRSFLMALVIITVVMTIVQGDVGAGLVAMVSNVFPVVLMFGLLGWLRTPLDIGSVMTASLALGIAVDDTLHYLTFFRRGLDAGLSRQHAVLEAYRHCGRAMIQTSVTCGIGLSVFAFSDFVPTSRFAWLMVLLLSAALAGDLLLLPALLLGPLGRLFEKSAAESVVQSSGSAPSTDIVESGDAARDAKAA